MKRSLSWIVTGVAVTVLAAMLLASHRSYQPGALLAGHAQLVGECGSCHQPWHGPTNAGCIACHGKLRSTNKHTRIDPGDKDSGLIPGHPLKLFEGQLSCRSCHSEHQGAAVEVTVTAAFACTFCHQHSNIEAVAQHRSASLTRRASFDHMFARPFSHIEHRVALTSSYPPRAFSCGSCHQVAPVAPGGVEQMSLRWSGCGGTLCHEQPQGGDLDLPAALGVAPRTLPFSVRPAHLNAVFVHSAGHLQTPCEGCHTQMGNSKEPEDPAALTVSQCFSCHAHQPLPAGAAQARAGGGLTGVAWGAPVSERRVVACGQCHLFHIYGMVPLRDFPKPAPRFPAHQRAVITVNLPTLARAQAPLIKLVWHPHHLQPWWLGAVAGLGAALLLAGYIATLPPEPEAAARSGVAPQRGHQFPVLDDTFETNLARLYVVGEAAGTASINLAMRSGRQVVQAIATRLRHLNPPAQPDLYDVAIVGCGPSGLAATATAKSVGLKYLNLEKLTPAATLRSYPRAKFVQATPIEVEEYGSFFLEGDNSREALILEWDKIIGRMGLVINEREEVVEVRAEPEYFRLRTRRGNTYQARFLVLAIGVRGNPRRLDLPGEDEPGRVQYNLIEPAEFTGRRILVVGGGNGGAEVAQALAEPKLGNTVSYSFRSPALSNVTPLNADRIAALRASGGIVVYPATTLARIEPGRVVLQPAGPNAGGQAGVEVENDVIFAMLGAELPVGFFRAIGIKLAPRGR